MEKTLNHTLLPNNQTNLLSWDEIFELSYRYFQNEFLSNYITIATEYKIDSLDDIQYENDIKLFYRNTHTIIMSAINQCGIPLAEKRYDSMYDTLGIRKFLNNKLKTNHYNDIALYHSFFPNSKSHGMHNDVTDVYHWQHIGYTQWIVYDKKVYTYILKPGDCIFIPAGMYHEVLPLTARAGISFGFFPDDYNGQTVEDYLTKEQQNKYADMYGVPFDDKEYQQLKDELRSSTQ